MLKKLVFLLALVAFVLNTTGQDITRELDPITISSTLSPVRLSKTGRNIIVIQGKEISDLPVRTLDELLRYLPGIEVQSRGTMGAQSDVSLRGSTFQQVLVIIDGLRLNDPNTGHFNAYIPVNTDEIEKIEILKGPSSSIYGSDAVGGVIFISTKAMSAKFTNNRETGIQLMTGAYGLFNGSLTHQKNTSTGSFQTSAAYNHLDGPELRGINGFMDEKKFSATFQKKIQLWNIGYRSAYDERKFCAQNFYTSFVSDTATEKVKVFWNQLNATYQKGNYKLYTQAGFKNTVDHYQFSSLSAANSSFSNLFQFNTILQKNMSDKKVYSLGVQYLGRQILSNDRGKHYINQFAAFGLLQQDFGRFTSLNGSLRADYTETTGWVVLPQLNLSWKKDHIQFRASAANSFRNADFTELYNNYNKLLVKSGSIGNPDLSPEKTFVYELGGAWTMDEQYEFSFDFFRRKSNNLIDWVNTSYITMPHQANLIPTGNYLLARNIADITVSGAELDFSLSEKIGQKGLIRFRSGLVWLDVVNKNGPLSLYVSAAAKWLANFSVTYKNPFCNISFNGLFKERTPQLGSAALIPVSKNYFVTNFKLSLPLFKQKVLSFVEIDNLLNSQINDFLGTTLPGRWLQAGVRVDLK